jgi:hypothetical protein
VIPRSPHIRTREIKTPENVGRAPPQHCGSGVLSTPERPRALHRGRRRDSNLHGTPRQSASSPATSWWIARRKMPHLALITSSMMGSQAKGMRMPGRATPGNDARRFASLGGSGGAVGPHDVAVVAQAHVQPNAEVWPNVLLP